MKNYLLALDQGTSSSSAFVFDTKGMVIAKASQTVDCQYPNPGWVEQDPEQIWQTSVNVIRKVLDKFPNWLDPNADIVIGITNQRETTIVWDRHTGKPVYPAISWQDRRVAKFCANLKSQDLESKIHSKTGLVIDPFFSACKINWILNNIPDGLKKAQNGDLLFGTIDSYLIWKFSKGAYHVTDVTNASRTQLFNINNLTWDPELLDLFQVPLNMLPKVLTNTEFFANIEPEIFGKAIAIKAVMGDQQASAIGQACIKAKDTKATFGTGCFMLVNTANQAIYSNNKLLTTIAYKINNQISYAAEGSIFMAGAVIDWLKDNLNLFSDYNELEQILNDTSNLPEDEVFFIPAFTGLGAPFWDPHAKAAIIGMTRGTNKGHIIRAAIKAICFQVKDLINALKQDNIHVKNSIKVDGGLIQSNFLLQTLADITNEQVFISHNQDATALGVALLAGLSHGLYKDLNEATKVIKTAKKISPKLDKSKQVIMYQQWLRAINQVRT